MFPKILLDYWKCTNRWNEPFLSPLEATLAPPWSQNGLKMGCSMRKNGSKMCISKNDPGPSGVPKQVKCALFEPIASHFVPSKVTKGLENGLFDDQKLVKMG